MNLKEKINSLREQFKEETTPEEQYAQSAMKDVNDAVNGIIGSVDSKMPPEYHETHIAAETAQLPNLNPRNAYLLQQHINAHKLVKQGMMHEGLKESLGSRITGYIQEIRYQVGKLVKAANKDDLRTVIVITDSIGSTVHELKVSAMEQLSSKK